MNGGPDHLLCKQGLGNRLGRIGTDDRSITNLND